MGEEGRVGRWALGGDDLWPQLRPGVPREAPPADALGVHWQVPDAQRAGVEALRRSGIRRATPVFGTAAPPRLLSGAVRRWAYGLEERRPSRWLLLLAADRIDVWEHRLVRSDRLLPILTAALVGYLLTAGALRRWERA